MKQKLLALRPPLDESELDVELRELVSEGRLIRDDRIGWRCARCKCGPYRASWAIERHLQVCSGKEEAKSE